jgi:hypothetical protein
MGGIREGRGRRWAVSVMTVALAGAVLVGCSDDDPTAPEAPMPVAVVVVEPDGLVLAPGDTITLEAKLEGSEGEVLTGRVVTWFSSAPQFVRVSATGRLTAVAEGGPVLITATSEGKTGPAFVTVLAQNPVPELGVLDPAVVMAGSGPVNVTLLGQGFVPGTEARWNGQPRPTTWLAAGVLEVDLTAADVAEAGEGELRVFNPGPGGGLSEALLLGIVPTVPTGVVSVELTGPAGELAKGDAVTLSARALDAQGQPVHGRPVVWSSSDESVVSVTPGGAIMAHRAGTARIRAAIDGRWAEVEVTVRPGLEPVAYVLVEPYEQALLVGSTVPVGVRVISTNGTVLEGRAVSWSIDDPSVVAVDPYQGRLIGLRKGVTRVRATVGGKEGSARIEVRQYPAGTVHGYDLRLPVATVFPAVGATTWVVEGVARAATLHLTGATLDVDRSNDTYTLVWKLAVSVPNVGVVGSTARTETGTAVRYSRSVDDFGYLLTPTEGAAYEAAANRVGELRARRPLGDIPEFTYLFVLR